MRETENSMLQRILTAGTKFSQVRIVASQCKSLLHKFLEVFNWNKFSENNEYLQLTKKGPIPEEEPQDYNRKDYSKGFFDDGIVYRF